MITAIVSFGIKIMAVCVETSHRQTRGTGCCRRGHKRCVRAASGSYERAVPMTRGEMMGEWFVIREKYRDLKARIVNKCFPKSI